MTSDRDLVPAPGTAGHDDWLDGLLAADATATRDAYIGDDGFTARVMQAIPVARPAPAWRKPAVAALWGAAAAGLALAMPGVLLDVAREGYRFVATQPVSLSGIMGAAVAMVALTGAAAAYSLRGNG